MGSGSDSEQSRWCALTRVSFVTNKKGCGDKEVDKVVSILSQKT